MQEQGIPGNGKLAAVRQRFIDGLPQRLDEIRRCWRQVAEGVAESGDLDALMRHLHSLVGASGSFRFLEISAAADQLQQALAELMPVSGGIDPEIVGRLGILFGRLEDAVTHPLHEPSTTVGAATNRPAAPGEQRGHLLYLVDDDADMADYLTAQLKLAGYRVRVMDSAALLPAAVEAENPAAVIMDVMLPEGEFGGIDAIAAMRRANRLPLPVIFLSARRDMQSRLRAIRAGGDAYLTKPVDMHLLLERLLLLLDPVTGGARILVVEDDADQSAYLQGVLRQAGFDVEGLLKPEAIEQSLQRHRPDLILMDLYMPEVDGQELTALIRQFPAWDDVPVLFLSREQSPARQFAALKSGGDDFLQKPISPALLVDAVSLHLQRARARREAAAGVFHHMDLLANENLLKLLEVATAEEGGALLYLEPDIPASSEDLSALESALEHLMSNLARRYPDAHPLRFAHGVAMVMRHLGFGQARLLAQDICKVDHHWPGNSGGLVMCEPQLSVVEQIRRAGLACRKAQKAGGGRVVAQGLEAARRLWVATNKNRAAQLKADLDETRRRLRLLMQPMVDLVSGANDCIEVRSRLCDADVPGEGAPPSDFMRLMPYAGLAETLDQHVIEGVLAWAAPHVGKGWQGQLFMKISQQSLLDPAFPDWLVAALNRHGLPASLIGLSFDRPGQDVPLEAMAEGLRPLTALGCQLMVEGVIPSKRGSQIIHTLRPALVKLPQALTRALAQDAAQVEYVGEVVARIQKAGPRVVAGYVETAEVLSELYRCGVDLVQGYFVQPPLGAEEYAFDAPPETSA